MKIQAHIDDGGFGQALEALLRRTSDLTPAFKAIGSLLQTSTEQRIEKEGPGPEGQQWPALAPATMAQRGAGAKMLRDTGHLYQSLTYVADRLSVAVGTNRVYAAIQQLGGQAGRGHEVTIPARPYLGISHDDEMRIGDVMSERLMGGLS